LENEAGNAPKNNAGSNRLDDVGKLSVDAVNVLEFPEIAPASKDAPDGRSGEENVSDGRDNWEPMSPTEKATELPRRMWMIVTAACMAWAVIAAVVYFILI
jgi:hypothetical protein